MMRMGRVKERCVDCSGQPNYEEWLCECRFWG